MNVRRIASSFTSPMNQRLPCSSDAEDEWRITFEQSVSRSTSHRTAICPSYLRRRETRSKSISTLPAISTSKREYCRGRIPPSHSSNSHIVTKSRKSSLHALVPAASNCCRHKVSYLKSYGWPATFKLRW